jgi:hypothetical protein
VETKIKLPAAIIHATLQQHKHLYH